MSIDVLVTKIPVKKYIKLGTGIRYLIDAQEGEEFGGRKILHNIDTALELIEELNFNTTLNSSGCQQLREINSELQSASLTTLALNNDQKERLEEICRKIRETLFAEGDKKFVCESESGEQREMTDNNDWKSSLFDFYSNYPQAYSLTLGFLAFGLGLVAMGLITTPWVQPHDPSIGNNQSPKNISSVVKVNLFCEWASQARLNQPINSAIVTVTSVKTGIPIPTLGNNIDTDGRISFSMNRNDVASVKIKHPDIKDSQLQIPNIDIPEEEAVLKEQKYTVARYNCAYDAK